MDPIGARLLVLVDTREKAPLIFPGHEVRRTTLRYGDYSAWGLKGVVEIERKSVYDMAGTCVLRQRWEGFLRKCDRWHTLAERHRAPMIVVVEGHITDIYRLPFTQDSQVKARGVNLYFHRVQLLMAMGIQVLYAGNRDLASHMILGLLGRELEAREKGLTVREATMQREPDLRIPVAKAL